MPWRGHRRTYGGKPLRNRRLFRVFPPVWAALIVWGFSVAQAAPPLRLGSGQVTNQEMEAALTCQCSCGLTVHNCNHLQCGFAIPAKEQIAEQLEQGQSREAILASFVSRYGEKVLSAPTATGFNLAAWVTPFLVVLIGAVSIGFLARRWAKRPSTSDAQGLTPRGDGRPSVQPERSVSEGEGYQERLKKELETFEG